jgi:hypothetical protein
MEIKSNEGLKIKKELIWKIGLQTDVHLTIVVSYYMVSTLIKNKPYPFTFLGSYYMYTIRFRASVRFDSHLM